MFLKKRVVGKTMCGVVIVLDCRPVELGFLEKRVTSGGPRLIFWVVTLGLGRLKSLNIPLALLVDTPMLPDFFSLVHLRRHFSLTLYHWRHKNKKTHKSS